MKIIDTHCDALLKLQLAKKESKYKKTPLNFTSSIELETNYQRLQTGQIKVQFFAIFLYPTVPVEEKWADALNQVHLFYTEILAKNPQMKHIKKWEDLNELKVGEIGAVLALEGADAIGNDIDKLIQLYDLGVLSIGLTWNNANLCADGVLEGRGAGLTDFGKEVVKLNNVYQILTDVSHLSEKSFWDVMELADFPFASHSNAFSICPNPRNLNDAQIKAMIEKEGHIHVVFYPPFINGNDTCDITDLIKHIDHLCTIGGLEHIGFGSDFDGIDLYVRGLEHAGKYQNLINELLKYYSEDAVKGFAYNNFLNSKVMKKDNS